MERTEASMSRSGGRVRPPRLRGVERINLHKTGET
jgi:hypothetical protein